MNHYPGHPAFTPGHQQPHPGDAAAGGGGGRAGRRWQRHDSLAPLGTPGSGSMMMGGGGGSGSCSSSVGSSFGFGMTHEDDGSSCSWLPPTPAMTLRQRQQQLQLQQQQLQQQQHRHPHQHQHGQQQGGEGEGEEDDDEEEEEEEEDAERGGAQGGHGAHPHNGMLPPACWPHNAVQKPQDPHHRSPPMRSPRWLKQYVAGASGAGEMAPAYGQGGGGAAGR